MKLSDQDEEGKCPEEETITKTKRIFKKKEEKKNKEIKGYEEGVQPTSCSFIIWLRVQSSSHTAPVPDVCCNYVGDRDGNQVGTNN